MVNEPLQPRQTRKGDNLTKKGDISVVLIHNKIKNWLRLYFGTVYYHNGSVINSSTRFIYGRVLDKLQQSYTPPNYPGWGWGVGGGYVIRLLMFAGPNKSDYIFIPDAINEREFM